ncbi:MAG: dihydropteroate synthase [Steroidobacteraceae bacterium]|nr:dihydropteroate synthase [Steroidobacteraceae bacterium]
MTPMRWRCRERIIDLGHPVVMGVLNVTPDSFSDGGRYLNLPAAFDRAARLVEEGAAIIDVGGESTRPGSLPVDAQQQIERVAPLIETIRARLNVAVSVDTSEPEVMRAAVEAGACIVNDVKALRLPGALAYAAAAGVGVCLMHMRGEPRTMQDEPRYENLVGEVAQFLKSERQRCIVGGIAPDAIALDPGIGFGKRLEHNLQLLRELPTFTALGAPLLVGVSRKGFIGRVLGREVHERLYGGLGLAALAVVHGARIVRTHDVAPTLDAIRMVDAVMQGMNG